jgi:3-phenylpropionate/trans-cinnamate dioxygenase ferredoxin reductase component
MRSFRYLVVGGGMTGDAVCNGIRDADPDGAIGLVGEEIVPPYKRPPLTKGLWKGADEEKIWRNVEEHGAELVLGRRVVSIDPDAHKAVDDAGDEYAYERLVLATGGTPRRLGGDDANVVYYRTLEDYRRVRALSDGGARFLVVGGGFIGSEIAAALRLHEREVTMVFPEPGIGRRTFTPALSDFVTEYYRERGVDVRTESMFESTEGFDAVVAGLGIVPRTELAEAAGLPVEDGILVDEYGRVGGRDDVFAAGDVARFPMPALGKTGRVEHEDHANTHGRVVGANAAGAGERYEHLPFFYSDLFDLGYEAVGEVNPSLATVEVWLEPNRKGVVAFVDDDSRPRGFLLWDVWGKVEPATELIRSGKPVSEDALRGLAG